jgi:hypothetical protein
VDFDAETELFEAPDESSGDLGATAMTAFFGPRRASRRWNCARQ